MLYGLCCATPGSMHHVPSFCSFGFYPQACEVLARAMKEWERRPTERVGFTESPADCLAFKYFRDVSTEDRGKHTHTHTRTARGQHAMLAVWCLVPLTSPPHSHMWAHHFSCWSGVAFQYMRGDLICTEVLKA